MRKENNSKGIQNKKFAVILSCVLILAVCVTSVVAYLADADRAKNRLVIGGNRITVEEGFIPPPELKPGVTFTKNVRVKNTGLSDCFIRIKAVFTTSDMEKYCEVDWNTTSWVYNTQDGYYYFTEILSIGEESPSLMTTVKIKDDAPDEALTGFSIIIYAESYQSHGFGEYQDAWANYQKNKS